MSLPRVASRPEPLAVIAHGAGGSAEAHCSAWRRRFPERGFLLCLPGQRISKLPGGHPGYYYPNHHALERELVAALAALRARFGDAVDTERALYAGYSQGAMMGALMIVNHAATFTRLVLIEGGAEAWNVARAQAFRRAGGERVLFLCGVAGCARQARRAAEWLERGGVEAVAEHAEGAGHTYGGAVAERLAARLSWLLEDDPRWQ